jgi:Uma2 family endonuclease
MAIERGLLAYEDFLAMPEDGVRREILDGELVVTASPVTLHQLVLGNLNDIVRGHVRAHGLGSVFFAPLSVVLANTTVVVPDLVYIAADRSSRLGARGVEGAPTLRRAP